jgi:hypothetical protein
MAVAADLADPVELERVVTAAETHPGRLDVLVDNAALGGRASLAEISAAEFGIEQEICALLVTYQALPPPSPMPRAPRGLVKADPGRRPRAPFMPVRRDHRRRFPG